MKNSEFYQQANDQIKAEEKLKRITKNRVFEDSKHHANRFLLKLANATLAVLLVFSIAWLSMTNQDKQANKIESILTPDVVKKEKRLPTVDNSETLISMLEQVQKEQKLNYEAAVMTDSQEKNNEVSRTNEQVEGVAEADVVQTDGEYLYTIAQKKINIIKADTMQMIQQITYDETNFNPSEMFLEGNHLIVIGETLSYPQKNYACYDMIYAGNACAIVYDVTKKDAPIEQRRVELEGYLQDARMIEDTVYLIANQYVYLTEEKKENPELLRPCYCDTTVSKENQKIEFSDIYYFPGEIEESSYLLIASFSSSTMEKASIETYLGAGNHLYCSKENLYITKVRQEYDFVEQAKTLMGFRSYTSYTDIYRFALKEGKAIYEAKGEVPGHVLNQFSMDEQNGYFRIATNQDENIMNENQTNALYILNQDLNLVGTLENLAKGEEIYAVRYRGDRAYIVTFKQTDPLFVIDLSNPYAPIVLGELKIPGFSNYLHPYDETHLIGIGQDTEEKNGNVVTAGMKISIFDVQNEKEPKELYSIKIGGKGTYSEALYNHKAVLFSKEKNILAFPINIMEQVENQTKITLKGAIVYGISLEEGIYEKGRISYEEDSGQRQVAQRCLYIGNTLYVCATGSVRAFNLSTMQEIGRVNIEK